MTFAKEDEVFPTIIDTSVDKDDGSKDDVVAEKEEGVSEETAEINGNGKRKLPEEETEKKVFVSVFSVHYCFFNHNFSLLRPCMLHHDFSPNHVCSHTS